MMNELLMLMFTAIIAAATCVYTYMTVKLWKATRASVDVAKGTVFLNYLGMVTPVIEKSQSSNPQEAVLLSSLTMLVAKAFMDRMMEDVDLNKQPKLRDALNKVDGLLRSRGIDPASIPLFRPITDRMRLDH